MDFLLLFLPPPTFKKKKPAAAAGSREIFPPSFSVVSTKTLRHFSAMSFTLGLFFILFFWLGLALLILCIGTRQRGVVKLIGTCLKGENIRGKGKSR